MNRSKKTTTPKTTNQRQPTLQEFLPFIRTDHGGKPLRLGAQETLLACGLGVTPELVMAYMLGAIITRMTIRNYADGILERARGQRGVA